MKWSPDHQFLATGGNDNQLLIWSLHRNKPVQTYAQHTAAVKVRSVPSRIILVLVCARNDNVVCCRRWHGARTSTACSYLVAARPTARCASGTRSPARQCTASTLARKCATSSGRATHPNWYSSLIVVRWTSARDAYPVQVSTHGYSQNQIVVWSYPSLTQEAKLTGHTSRVLYLVSHCAMAL